MTATDDCHQSSIPIPVPRHQSLAESVNDWTSSYVRSQEFSSSLGAPLAAMIDEEPCRNMSESDIEHAVVHAPADERTPLMQDFSTTRTTVVEEDDLHERKKSTFAQTVFNAVNVLAGMAILSLPLAFKFSGWILGLSIFAFCLILTNYTAKAIAKCLSLDTSLHTYVDLADYAYGANGSYFIGMLFILELFNACVALMILVGDSLKILFPQVALLHLKLIAFLIITPATFLPIRVMSYTSIIGIVATVFLVGVLLIDGFSKNEAPGSLLHPMDTSLLPPVWLAVPLSFGLINSGFAGHAVLPSLFRDMDNPRDIGAAVDWSYAITSLLYILVAVSGYLMFGENVMKEITQNIMETPGYYNMLNVLVVCLIVINPMTKFPLGLHPINTLIEMRVHKIPFIGEFLKHKRGTFSYRAISRTLVSAMIVTTAIVFPGFDRVLSLLGSFFSFLICGIFPLLCHLRLFGPMLTKSEYVWNIFLLTLSAFMGIMGTVWTFFPQQWFDHETRDRTS